MLANGAVLRRSLAELFALYPAVRTVSVVPLGMTSHRQGLPVLPPVGRAEAQAAVAAVEEFAGECLGRSGVRFAFAADELYERANLPPKRYPDGENNPQVGNGVGMVSNMLDEFEWALTDLPKCLPAPRYVTIVTGVSAARRPSRLESHPSHRCIQSGGDSDFDAEPEEASATLNSGRL